MGKLGDENVEYAKNKELKKEDITLLMEWMSKQPHLPKITEFQLILFLHSCYYRIEPTKTCIETFYTARAHCPEFFANQNPVTYESEIFDTFFVTPLPKPSALGYQVIFMKFLSPDATRFVFTQTIKSFDMSATLMLQQKGTAPGHVMLADLKNMSFGYVTKLTPTFLMKFFFYLQEALPFRLKGLYFFNIPTFMDKVMAMLKPFMKKELLGSLQLYTDQMDDLYKIIPQECFPKDYGGEADSLSELAEQRKQNFFANEAFFVEREKEISDESRRVGKPRHAHDIYGMEGTFKKLEID